MTVKRARWTLTVIALLLAIAHLSLAALSACTEWGVPVLWFAGSGLALLVTGLLNLVALRARVGDPMVRGVSLLSNLAVAGFFLLAWPLVKQPQVVVGFVVFGLLALGAAWGSSDPQQQQSLG